MALIPVLLAVNFPSSLGNIPPVAPGHFGILFLDVLTRSLMMTLYPIRRSLSLTQDMADRLALLVSQQNRDVTEADLIRDAIRRYLD